MLLKKTLESLSQISPCADSEYELIVINNNCTDDTSAVIQSMEGLLPIREIVELKKGLSAARNRALKEAQGDYIIFTDDDVTFESDWLKEYIIAFQKFPEAAFFGGAIEPDYEIEPPRWIADNVEQMESFLVRRVVNCEGEINQDYLPFGASVAFKSSAIGDMTFSEELGRTGASLLGGEETLFIRKLMEKGCKGYWVPKAMANHFLPATRLTFSFFWKLNFSTGCSIVRENPKGPESFQRKPLIYILFWSAKSIWHGLR